jgi:hypothetical protein
VAHDRDPLCDSYIVSSIHDTTESYYERGKHGLMDLNNIEFPLFMLQSLKLYLFCLLMAGVVDDNYYGQAVGKLQAESMMSTAASLFP